MPCRHGATTTLLESLTEHLVIVGTRDIWHMVRSQSLCLGAVKQQNNTGLCTWDSGTWFLKFVTFRKHNYDSVAFSGCVRPCVAPNAPVEDLSWNRFTKSTCVFESRGCELEKTPNIIEIGSKTKQLEAFQHVAKMEHKITLNCKYRPFYQRS